jgi:hypothetical protein
VDISHKMDEEAQGVVALVPAAGLVEKVRELGDYPPFQSLYATSDVDDPLQDVLVGFPSRLSESAGLGRPVA